MTKTSIGLVAALQLARGALAAEVQKECRGTVRVDQAVQELRDYCMGDAVFPNVDILATATLVGWHVDDERAVPRIILAFDIQQCTPPANRLIVNIKARDLEEVAPELYASTRLHRPGQTFEPSMRKSFTLGFRHCNKGELPTKWLYPSLATARDTVLFAELTAAIPK